MWVSPTCLRAAPLSSRERTEQHDSRAQPRWTLRRSSRHPRDGPPCIESVVRSIWYRRPLFPGLARARAAVCSGGINAPRWSGLPWIATDGES